ncbi:MAG: hypothetical protein FWD94_06170 [Treponema sp.]|nr:hypothetical protein [Treponema sp.]
MDLGEFSSSYGRGKFSTRLLPGKKKPRIYCGEEKRLHAWLRKGRSRAFVVGSKFFILFEDAGTKADF